VLEQRLQEVRTRIEKAAEKAGRDPASVTLVAVTKKFAPEILCQAYQLGVRHFGENYVQEFAGKRPALGEMPGAVFHLIGHLQSNKSRQAGELFDVIETVDSAKLGRRLDELAKPIDVMIEVKLSEEESKAGAAPEELPELIAALRACSSIKLTGLMTMPPWSTDAELSRPYFKKLASLAREHNLPNLSMGMSNDFEVAIEEGATHVRVGTALFGSRPKP
jgi:pyridoxal phosphate enzyme (YggS family)